MAESKDTLQGACVSFFYASFGASGAIGGFVFFTKILAGRDIAESLPNLALQLGVVALMVFLFRLGRSQQGQRKLVATETGAPSAAAKNPVVLVHGIWNTAGIFSTLTKLTLEAKWAGVSYALSMTAQQW